MINPLPPTAPPTATTPDARIQKTAQDFTASALAALLAPIFGSVDETGGQFGGGAGEAAFRPMLVQEYATALARQGGLGLTAAVAHSLLQLQESKP